MEDWIKVDRWSSLKAAKNQGMFSIMRGRPTGDGVISPEYTIKSDWQNSKIIPAKKDNGDWWVLPPRFSLGDDKAKALEILKAIIWQVEQL